VFPGWDIYHLIHKVASDDHDDGHDYLCSPIVYRAFEGARAELLAGLESTYATFLPLAVRSMSLIQALEGYDNLLEDLEMDRYFI
jgi:hypothetical protein